MNSTQQPSPCCTSKLIPSSIGRERVLEVASVTTAHGPAYTFVPCAESMSVIRA